MVEQVAAECGRLELCEFLLQEFPVFRSDALMHDALKGVLDRNVNRVVKFGRIRRDRRDYDDTPDASYELFLRKYGFSADLQDSTDTILALPKRIPKRYQFEKREDVAHSMLLTDMALQNIMASQLVPFAKRPLPQRLDTALSAKGWPARSFVKLVNTESTTELAHCTDSQGKTALHWAAEHFGYWMSKSDHRVLRALQDHYERRPKEYSELIAMLITHGADVHALNSRYETPFARMIQGPHPGIWNWEPEDLCAAIARWGLILQEVCISLPCFADMENRLQSENAACSLMISGMKNVWTYKLVVLDGPTLAIEVGGSLQCSLWKYCPPPGVWTTTSTYQIDRIMWDPKFEEDDWYLWQQCDTPEIHLAPKLLLPPKTPCHFAESVIQSWEEYFYGTQDDHGFVAMTERRCIKRARTQLFRRRSSSLPPPATMLNGAHFLSSRTKVNWNYIHWVSPPHRCPLNLTWMPTRVDLLSRTCMRGLCGEENSSLVHGDHWEAQLLRDENNIEIARRFTKRFRPEWIEILAQNHARARQRAEIGISVA